MKTILSFIDWYSPGYKAGGTVRAFSNMLSFLNKDFVFYIVTRNNDYTETKPYPNIQANTWTTVEKNIHVFYASPDYICHSNWKEIIRNTPYDMIYFHGIFSYWFSILPLVLNRRHHKRDVLIAAHGMLGDHAFNVKSLKKNVFLQLIKISGLYKHVVFHAANTEEASDIRKRAGSSVQIKIADELPMNKELRLGECPNKEKDKLKLVYLGRISPEKNLKFGLEILNEFKSGEISLDIIGPVYNESYWQECKTIIDSLPKQISVVYRGSLHADEVMNALQKYHALFLPSNGENFGHAILESMMAGRPVIISDQTPWKDLQSNGAGFDCSLSDTRSFEKAIQLMLDQNQKEYNSLVQSTSQYIQSYINNPTGLRENINLFNTIQK